MDFVQRPSCLHISTIHGVLGLFLSRYGAGIGLSPQLKVISEVQEKLMIKKLIRSLNQTSPEFATHFQNLLEVVEFSDLLSAEGPAGQRYCMNSASMRFVPKEELEAQGYGKYLSLFK